MITPLTQWLTKQQVADSLHCCVATIALWIKQGKFPGAKRHSPAGSSKWLIPASDVEALMRPEEK
jgi:predicted site-specific integrase-resolvase